MSDVSWIDDGYDQECIEPGATVNNEFVGVEASTSKSVCAGNESDQDDSDATEVSNKTVQTEQAAHRQQSCSSRLIDFTIFLLFSLASSIFLLARCALNCHQI